MDLMYLEDLGNLTIETLVTKNRDKVQLSIERDTSSIPVLEDTEGYLPIKGHIVNANLIKLSVGGTSVIRVLGINQSDSTSFITSVVTGIKKSSDNAYLVRTANSFYTVELQEEVPDLTEVLFLAGYLRMQGLGEFLGLPEVFF